MTSSEDDLKGGISLWKNLLMEVYLNENLTGLILACIASQFCTDVCPAQPQFVQFNCQVE